MFLKLVLMLFFLVTLVVSEDNSFIYNEFQSSHLYVDGFAELTSEGIVRLTNDTEQGIGHAFYPNPIVFKNTSSESVSSFSTTFVFDIIPQYHLLLAMELFLFFLQQKSYQIHYQINTLVYLTIPTMETVATMFLVLNLTLLKILSLVISTITTLVLISMI